MVRQWAPTIPLLANLGLVHVKKGKDYLLEAIEAIGADGLTLYVNPLHEILQVDGEKDFGGALDALAAVLRGFPYPVFLKEVGFGFPVSLMKWASKQPVAGIDTAGAGGANWATIEGITQSKDYRAYKGLGMPTAEVIVAARKELRPDQLLVGSGGVRTGIDVAKTLTLGADLAAMALPFLKWAAVSAEEVVSQVGRIREELTVAMWYCGCRDVKELRQTQPV